MSDRELLELAAKAAGIDGEVKDHGGVLWLFRANFESPWNPLADDRDALQLAVKLQLGVAVYDDRAEAMDEVTVDICELIDGDPYAATRRAIVRAAAEIGRTL